MLTRSTRASAVRSTGQVYSDYSGVIPVFIGKRQSKEMGIRALSSMFYKELLQGTGLTVPAGEDRTDGFTETVGSVTRSLQ